MQIGGAAISLLGLQRGDHIAIPLENHPIFSKFVGLLSSGLYFTASATPAAGELNTSLTIARPSIYYVRRPSGGCRAFGRMAHVEACFTVEGEIPGYQSWSEQWPMPAEPIGDQSEGAYFILPAPPVTLGA